jgi:hypothetical protein
MRHLVHSVVFALAGLLSVSAQAALVNTGPNVWHDTVTNQEWLNLGLTTSEAMGLTDPSYDSQFPENQTTVGELLAAVSNSNYVTAQGFSIATTSEVAALYTNSMGVYGGAVPFAADIWQLGETSAGLDYPVFDPSSAIVTADQTGLHYSDVGADLRSSYVGRDYIAPFGEPLGVYGDGWSVADAAVGADWIVSADDGCSNCGGYSERGVYLVRSVVPVPPAIWLFGSALAGLGWMRRKKSV